jgi:hypothetical protein
MFPTPQRAKTAHMSDRELMLIDEVGAAARLGASAFSALVYIYLECTRAWSDWDTATQS